MPETMGGFSYWELDFDENGKARDEASHEEVLRELATSPVREIFIFSHGWNNDRAMARKLYDGLFDKVLSVLRTRNAAGKTGEIGLIGVVWPSRRWSDETPPEGDSVAVGLDETKPDAELVRELKAAFPDPAKQRALEDMAVLLETKPRDKAALERFKASMEVLLAEPDAAVDAEPREGAALTEGSAEKVFQRFEDFADVPVTGGAMGFNPFAKLWGGAKEALRQASYFTMKKRAGIVGERGLGPFVTRLGSLTPPRRVHLIGHSFGARLVSFSLKGLDNGTEAPGRSPVKSMTLLQGAFSHFSFAASLPHDRDRSGALAGMEARVDGPIMVSHTLLDTACGELYPAASIASRQDAAGLPDLNLRWGAMGHKGAQASGAIEKRIVAVGRALELPDRRITNLDSNAVIRTGRAPSGAHSDLLHEEVAWAILLASRVLTTT